MKANNNKSSNQKSSSPSEITGGLLQFIPLSPSVSHDWSRMFREENFVMVVVVVWFNDKSLSLSLSEETKHTH